MKDIYDKLVAKPPSDDTWKAESIGSYDKYFLCVDKKKAIYFCITPIKISEATTNAQSRKGTYAAFVFGEEKNITIKNTPTKKEFVCYIKLEDPAKSKEFTQRYLEDCQRVVDKFKSEPIYEDLINHLNARRELYEKLTSKTNITELGLWGELFLISNSKVKMDAIKSWHMKDSDTFDFNNSKHILEVKTTVQNLRKHSTSLEQINYIKQHNGSLMSIMTAIVDEAYGTSVKTLVNEIKTALNKPEDQQFFMDKLDDLTKLEHLNFRTPYDKSLAKQSTKAFCHNSLDSIDHSNIPPSISQIKFAINLENIKHKNNTEFNSLEKNLLTN